ncbi:major facilitator superfamily domain-containing protein [Aspergillus heterothallicus]
MIRAKYKWFTLSLVSVTAFLSPLASSIPATGPFSVSVYVLGFALGPLVLSPLSEAYGRQIILNSANFFHSAWQLGCALSPNLASLIIFRFLAGVSGSACLTIGGGIIGDLFILTERGKANAIFTVGPLMGPVIGPVIGGFIAQRAGWRWVYWTLFIATAVVASVNLALGKETNHAVLARRARRGTQTNENGMGDGSSSSTEGSQVDKTSNPSTLSRLSSGLTRPVTIIARSPVLLFLTLYLSFVFGLLYLLFTTITTLFTATYGWPIELAGLSYLGLGLGFISGLILVGKTSEATVTRLTARNKGVYRPEMRLASCLITARFIPISFFWYGWAAHYHEHVHWITYFIDVSGPFAASAIAGLVAVRCLLGSFLPLAGPSMYEALGLGWGNSLLGVLPFLIYRYGGSF